MKVEELMVPRDALCILPLETTIDRVASSMVTRNISCVIIGNEQEDTYGLITKTDLIDLYSCGKNAEETVAKEVMETKIHFCNDKDSREKISGDMIKFKVHHLLVRNEKLELVGLVSTYDVIRSIALEFQENFPFIRNLFGIQSEKQKKWKEDLTFKFGKEEKVEPEKK